MIEPINPVSSNVRQILFLTFWNKLMTAPVHSQNADPVKINLSQALRGLTLTDESPLTATSIIAWLGTKEGHQFLGENGFFDPAIEVRRARVVTLWTEADHRMDRQYGISLLSQLITPMDEATNTINGIKFTNYVKPSRHAEWVGVRLMEWLGSFEGQTYVTQVHRAYSNTTEEQILEAYEKDGFDGVFSVAITALAA